MFTKKENTDSGLSILYPLFFRSMKVVAMTKCMPDPIVNNITCSNFTSQRSIVDPFLFNVDIISDNTFDVAS